MLLPVSLLQQVISHTPSDMQRCSASDVHHMQHTEGVLYCLSTAMLSIFTYHLRGVTSSFLDTGFAGTSLPMLGAGRTFSSSTSDVHHLQRVAPLLISSKQCGHFTLGAFGCRMSQRAQSST